MQDWLGSGDQYIIDSESHFPEERNTVRPGIQSDEPIRMPPRSVSTFEGKYLAENQGIPTELCRCPACRNYYYGPSVARPMRTETVDERDRRMYMNRCRPRPQPTTAVPTEHLTAETSSKVTIDSNMLLIMFLFIIVVFIACAVYSGIRIPDIFRRDDTHT